MHYHGMIRNSAHVYVQRPTSTVKFQRPKSNASNLSNVPRPTRPTCSTCPTPNVRTSHVQRSNGPTVQRPRSQRSTCNLKRPTSPRPNVPTSQRPTHQNVQRPTTAQQRPTANNGQQRPTTANNGQQRPTSNVKRLTSVQRLKFNAEHEASSEQRPTSRRPDVQQSSVPASNVQRPMSQRSTSNLKRSTSKCPTSERPTFQRFSVRPIQRPTSSV